MKTFTKIASTSALLLAMAAPAFSAVSSDLGRDIQSAVGVNGNVTYVVDGDTVTLNGFVEDIVARDAVVRAAKANGAETVINSITSSN